MNAQREAHQFRVTVIGDEQAMDQHMHRQARALLILLVRAGGA